MNELSKVLLKNPELLESIEKLAVVVDKKQLPESFDEAESVVHQELKHLGHNLLQEWGRESNENYQKKQESEDRVKAGKKKLHGKVSMGK